MGPALRRDPWGPPVFVRECLRLQEQQLSSHGAQVSEGAGQLSRLRSVLHSGVGPLGSLGWSGWALLGRWRNAQGGGWCGCWQGPQVTRWAKDRSRAGSGVELRGSSAGGVALSMAAWPPGPGPVVHRRLVGRQWLPTQHLSRMKLATEEAVMTGRNPSQISLLLLPFHWGSLRPGAGRNQHFCMFSV